MVRKLTLDQLIERNAYLYPEHPALLIDGRVITHAQMAERVGATVLGHVPRKPLLVTFSSPRSVSWI